MTLTRAKEYLKQYKLDNRILEFPISIAIVSEAAIEIGCQEGEIAKSLVFIVNDRYILIITAGDVKVDNRKFKEEFNAKAKMLDKDSVEDKIGHMAGGICPFGINKEVEVYLDSSLKRFTHVYPACGSSNSAIRLTILELEEYSNYKKWIDVCI